MLIPAGRRNTLVTFQRRTGTQSEASGAWTYDWTEALQEWCEVLDVLPSRAEQVSDGMDMARRPSRIRCTYRPEIMPDMRLAFDGRVLEIVSGPAVLGRNDGLEMIAQDMSTTGEAP